MNAALGFQGLRFGAAQTLGAFTLLPILRDDPPGDLRIARQRYDSFGLVQLGGRPAGNALHYCSYIPYGLVITHARNGSQVARATALSAEPELVTVHHRMVRGEKSRAADERRFRLLPLHLALEGFLLQNFRGPAIAWPEYSRQVLRRGLDPRVESFTRGTWLRGFADALRLFEIHEKQVGVAVFVASALAAIHVLSHPDDYRATHRSLLEDFYGELLWHYAMLHEAAPFVASFDATRVHDVCSLHQEIARSRKEHAAYGEQLLCDALPKSMCFETLRRSGKFTLERFLPSFDRSEAECHLGERILRSDGTLEYLKSYRLSSAQVRRGYLLSRLAAHDWQFAELMRELNASQEQLVARLRNAGLGYLLHPSILRTP